MPFLRIIEQVSLKALWEIRADLSKVTAAGHHAAAVCLMMMTMSILQPTRASPHSF